MIGPRSPGAGTPHPQSVDGFSTGGATSLHHQTSAKHLIARYESLTTPPPQERTPPTFLNHAKSLRKREQRRRGQSGHATGASADSHHGFTQPTSIDVISKKDRSPLRQSFRNLFSVLKKGANGLPGAVKKRLSEDKLGFAHKLRSSIDKDDLDEGLKVDPILESPDIDNPLDTPLRQKKKQTGPLLYLVNSSDGNNSQWIPADVTLDALYVSVAMFLSEMDLCVREIALGDCVDIRSVSLPQLGADEAEALDDIGRREGGAGGLRVFEMLLSGGKKERFAARSVKERAGWISSIWDATLPAQKLKAARGKKPQEETKHVERTPPQASQPIVEDTQIIPIESPMPTPLMKSSPLLHPSYSDRSLPPLPPSSPPPPLHLSIPDTAPLVQSVIRTGHIGPSDGTIPPVEGPISPSIYPPTLAPTISNGSVEKPYPKPPSLRVKTSSLARSNDRPSSSTLSPITPRSTPRSPSVQNLSQLSVVRQRLQQIERSHSALSTQTMSGLASGASTPVRARSPLSPVTPTRPKVPMKSPTTPGTLPTPTAMVRSPASPAGSTWSMGTAVFRNKPIVSSEGPSERNDRKDIPSDKVKTTVRETDRLSQSKSAEITLPPIEPLKVDRKSKEKEEMTMRNVGKESPAIDLEQSIAKALVPDGKQPWMDDIQKISRDLNSVKGVIGGESGYPTVHQMVVGLEHYAHSGKKSLKGIKENMEEVKQRMEEVATHAASTSAATMENGTKILQRLEEQHLKHLKAVSQSMTTQTSTTAGNGEVLRVLGAIESKLASEFPAVLQILTEIRLRESNHKREPSEGEGSSAAADGGVGMHALGNAETGKQVDLAPLVEKLEEIKTLCKIHSEQDAASKSTDTTPLHQELKLPELERILALVEEDGQKQALLSQQQADSVRYLNELNSWLEAFVNNGTSQIQGLATNVEQICKALGCLTPDYRDPRMPGAPPDSDGPKSLMNDIRELIAGMQARDQNFAALQAAVHSLLEVLTTASNRVSTDSRAIAGMIDQQRRDQETLFRAFTDEISGEIKGERLRFVEAMKEATAINVQLHVEQFKHELNREVMSVTEEVGRLHREKQSIEQQISELFSFYSKQKQGTMPLQNNQINTIENVPQTPIRQPQRANIPRSHHRPLPYVRHS
ncbi:hypothetical protein CVT24_011329 [Panaeolus cyanescens]|uniref:PH domain-containing protein n=1 Tax=Panaeolus cyanescens TaxID=181874 RepID=A0A409WDK6_9AGAR|nr:hypothetical protein CVT24_011329 [Panaeolus cyanescens]